MALLIQSSSAMMGCRWLPPRVYIIAEKCGVCELPAVSNIVTTTLNQDSDVSNFFK